MAEMVFSEEDFRPKRMKGEFDFSPEDFSSQSDSIIESNQQPSFLSRLGPTVVPGADYSSVMGDAGVAAQLSEAGKLGIPTFDPRPLVELPALKSRVLGAMVFPEVAGSIAATGAPEPLKRLEPQADAFVKQLTENISGLTSPQSLSLLPLLMANPLVARLAGLYFGTDIASTGAGQIAGGEPGQGIANVLSGAAIGAPSIAGRWLPEAQPPPLPVPEPAPRQIGYPRAGEEMQVHEQPAAFSSYGPGEAGQRITDPTRLLTGPETRLPEGSAMVKPPVEPQRVVQGMVPPIFSERLSGWQRPAAVAKEEVVVPVPEQIQILRDLAQRVEALEQPRSPYQAPVVSTDLRQLQKRMQEGMVSTEESRPEVSPVPQGVVPEKVDTGSTEVGQESLPKQEGMGRRVTSLGFLDPDFWKDIGKSSVVMDAKQIYNRMRNKLGVESAAWKAVDTEEFKKAMVGKKSVEEVEKLVGESGPKVEIKPIEGADFTKVGANPLREVARAVRSTYNDLKTLRDKIPSAIRSRPLRADVVRFKDAADNKADIAAQQLAKGIRSRATETFGKESDQALDAVTAVIEAKGDLRKLTDFVAKATAKGDERGLKAAEFAQKNWGKLQPIVDEVNRIHNEQMAEEKLVGMDYDSREGYIRHAYDLTKVPHQLMDQFFTGGQGTGGRGFTKQRTFDTLYDAIEGGYGEAIRSWNAADLVQSRVANGLRSVNNVKWLEGLKGFNDPTSKTPIVREMVKKKNPQTGRVNLVAPAGYEAWSANGLQTFAVHRGYTKLLNSVSATSAIRDFELAGLPVGEIALQGTGRLKHSLLLYDTYHAMRMSAKGMSIKGSASYGKGLSLLEYNDTDLARAVKNKEISQEMADYALKNRATAELLVNNGLNVGRIAEALYTSAGIDYPFAKNANKWIFEKLTRGIMMESAVLEFNRLSKSGKLSPEQVAKKVARDVNFNFGNIGRQGLLKSRTMQDLSRIVFLAPQWFESMAQTELRSVGQAVKAPLTGEVGTLAKGTAGLLGAMFLATQVANLAFRGKPTWQNEEGHKLDAWIPGGENGFWVSPLSLPMDLTHDVIRYAKDMPAWRVPFRILSNKYSPLFRAEEVLRTGEDYSGKKLAGKDAVVTAAESLLPLPLPTQPLFKKTYPGAVERQALASAGIKAEPVKKTQQQRFEEQVGKPLESMSLKEREKPVTALKQKRFEQKGPQTPEQKAEALRYVADKQLERDTALQKALPPYIHTFLEENKLKLPGFGEVKEHRVTVPLSDKEEKHYVNLMKEQYQKQLDRLMASGSFEQLPQAKKQERVNQFLLRAKHDARRQLEADIKNGTITEEKKRRFTILPE